MLHGNDRGDKDASERNQDTCFDARFKQEGGIVPSNELGNGAQATKGWEGVSESNARRDADAGEAVDAIRLRTIKV